MNHKQFLAPSTLAQAPYRSRPILPVLSLLAGGRAVTPPALAIVIDNCPRACRNTAVGAEAIRKTPPLAHYFTSITRGNPVVNACLPSDTLD
ncbi:hypothetical protein PQR05_17305 [Paraburkholderia sediminicola]|uniref:Uncharacterized protein n=1 Tax=Paraburkholderia metrosideri TaxID=580937 RepID=A0ABW9DXG0_9BURK